MPNSSDQSELTEHEANWKQWEGPQHFVMEVDDGQPCKYTRPEPGGRN